MGTSELHYLLGKYVRAAEDEIGAIHHCLGAAYAGARSVHLGLALIYAEAVLLAVHLE